MSLYKLPKEMYAEIARFLGYDFPGNGFRLVAGDVQIKDSVNGSTYLNGILHSFDDRPAVITASGNRGWYRNGKLHRENGPAVIRSDGTYEWYINGKLHRENDLPAIMWSDGTREWYTHGVFMCIACDYFY